MADFSDHSDISILIRVTIAMLLAGCIGWEREATGKAAGIRTHMLVGIGASLFVGLGDIIVRHASDVSGVVQADPVRVLEAIVTGISFLGAGTIFVSRGNHVKGLTTAASIWATAAVGIAVGLERYLLAVGSTVLVFAVLHFMPRSKVGASEDAAAADSNEVIQGEENQRGEHGRSRLGAQDARPE